jgi:hypothetical protein
MSLLSICQNAADEVGIRRPTAIINATDATAVRCLRYVKRVGRELVKMNIDYLIKEHTFPTVASQEIYSLPSDFDHFVPFTNWNRTTSRRMYPIQPNEWQYFRSGLATVSLNDRFRIKGADRDFSIEPIPTSVETVSFEYVSENYCESAGGTGQSTWTADTDVGVIDEDIFEMGVIWRLLNRMGQPYAEEKAEYQRSLNTMIAQINPQKVSLNGTIPASSNLPDSDFPSS